MSEFWHKLGCCVVEKPQPVSLPSPPCHTQKFVTMCWEVDMPSLICLLRNTCLPHLLSFCGRVWSRAIKETVTEELNSSVTCSCSEVAGVVGRI